MLSTTSTEESIKGIHYAYFPDTIVLRRYQEGQYFFQDSLLSVAGNFRYFSESTPLGDDWYQVFSYRKEILSGYSNPFYNATLSRSLGAFYIVLDNLDFLSKNFTTLQGFYYTWSTDAKGRVINAVAPDGSYVKYTYK